MPKRGTAAGKALLVAGVFVVGGARAQTRVWTGHVNTDWHTPGNWDTGAVPGENETAVIGAGTVVLGQPTDALAALTLSGGLLVFSNWTTRLTAVEVTLDSGQITCAGPFNSYTNAVWPAYEGSNRVAITCSNLTVGSGAAIDVTGKGYRGGHYVDPSYYDGHGPGGGARMVGASHGAYGGYGLTSLPKAPYGDPLQPTAPGSGGGCDYFVGGAAPGHGGGAIEILASGVVTVNGAIRADGIGHVGGRRGGGSGGSIYVACSRLAGTGGVLSAEGGHTVLTGGGGSQGGSGSGGRLAVRYDPAAQAAWPGPNVTLSALSRMSVYGVYAAKHNGDLGTVCVPDDRLFAFTHSGVWLATHPSISALSVDSLGLSTSNNWLRLLRDPFALTVTNALSICNGGRLDLTAGSVSCGSLVATNSGGLVLSPGSDSSPRLNIQGDALLAHDSFLYVASGPTNGTSPYGGAVTIGGALSVTHGAWVLPQSDPTNGGSVTFTVGSLTVASNSGFNADARGYEPKVGKGYGPGGGVVNGISKSGGGYGGAGGKGVDTGTTASATYGVKERPQEPGSAAGGTTAQGGYGGGLIRIASAGDVILDGLLTANGQQAQNIYYAGGAGGGLLVICRRFGGNGRLSATGGNGGTHASQGGGGGGGGRIAVLRQRDLVNAVTTQVGGGTATGVGTGGAAAPGQDGSVHWGVLPAPSTVVTVR